MSIIMFVEYRDKNNRIVEKSQTSCPSITQIKETANLLSEEYGCDIDISIRDFNGNDIGGESFPFSQN